MDPSTTGGPPSAIDEAVGATRGGLTRRIPGTHLAASVHQFDDPGPPRPARDPEAERAALNDFLAGFARGAQDPTTAEENA